MSYIIQLMGAGCFGALIGWYVYYINRYRKDSIQLSDVGTLVGILGGATILTLFQSSTDLFGSYGIGLAVGFFGYFGVLIVFVYISDEFGVEWFLDGRRKDPSPPFGYGDPSKPKDNPHVMSPSSNEEQLGSKS